MFQMRTEKNDGGIFIENGVRHQKAKNEETKKTHTHKIKSHTSTQHSLWKMSEYIERDAYCVYVEPSASNVTETEIEREKESKRKKSNNNKVSKIRRIPADVDDV